MRLQDAPAGYRWRIRRVYLLGDDNDLVALVLEPETAWRRIWENSYSGLPIKASEASSRYFTNESEKLVERYNQIEIKATDNIKKFVGVYTKTGYGYERDSTKR